MASRTVSGARFRGLTAGSLIAKWPDMFERLRIPGPALGAACFCGLLAGVALTWACAAFGVMALTHGPFASHGCRPPSKMAKLMVQETHSALLQYQIDSDRSPTRYDLTNARYVNRRSLIDPWGTSIASWCRGENVEVRSAGPDKLFKTDDDITQRW